MIPESFRKPSIIASTVKLVCKHCLRQIAKTVPVTFLLARKICAFIKNIPADSVDKGETIGACNQERAFLP